MSDNSTPAAPSVDPQPVPPAPASVQDPALAPAAPKKSKLPLLALIFAGVAFLFAIIPLTAGFAWLFALTGIILAIVALAKKAQPRTFAIIAIIAAPLAWIVAIVVSIATAAAILGSAVEAVKEGTESSVEQPVDAGESGDADDEGADAVGTRANPAALGSTIEGSDWTVVVNSVTFGADEAIAAENMFNEEAPEGHHFILVNYTATYTGDDADGQLAIWASVEYVTPDGKTIDTSDVLASAPDAIDRTSTLYTGASVTGNIAFAVPVADADQGVLAVSPGMFSDKVFVAVK